jgi:hypothetical protein
MDTRESEHLVEQRRLRHQRRRARNSQELSTLLGQREDLSGVSSVADLVVESVRWTA